MILLIFFTSLISYIKSYTSWMILEFCRYFCSCRITIAIELHVLVQKPIWHGNTEQVWLWFQSLNYRYILMHKSLPPNQSTCNYNGTCFWVVSIYNAWTCSWLQIWLSARTDKCNFLIQSKPNKLSFKELD